MKDNNCCCSKCENVELTLNGIKNALIKNKQNNHASTLKIDADSFMGSIVCSVKNQECCEGNCLNCAENDHLMKFYQFYQRLKKLHTLNG